MDAENPLEAFISKAKASGGAERANYQLFVVELCEVLGVPRPEYASEDTALDNYVFERLCCAKVEQRIHLVNPEW